MENSNNESTIVQTNEEAKNGQNKCPKCGATDISLNVNTGKLRCNYCRHEFAPKNVTGLEKDISNLHGQVLGAGAKNIETDAENIITLKCSSCGAEVVIDTSESAQARCHWCRNTLSINQQVPNGSVPDVVLPFKVTRDVAKNEIETFVEKRKFFAHPKFKQEFTTNNIMGVYFPYMLIDINAHADFSGEGEHETRRYYVGNDENKKPRYDADLYHVEREFDIAISDLSIESSKDKLDYSSSNKTNNIINAIMPFDTENSVRWDANYLKGYSSEKRDVNVEQLKDIVNEQAKDIARFKANDTLRTYDRGVAWSKQELYVKGEQWKAAYLPVWLYSYQEIKGDKKVLHYVAVNARTKEVMGSVPIHMPKLVGVSFVVEILGFIAMFFVDWDYSWLFLTLGFIFFSIMFFRYRNSNARHKYESETKSNIDNLRKVDTFIESRKGLSDSSMIGANNKSINGNNIASSLINSIKDKK